MCRLLITKAKEKKDMSDVLSGFADMAEKSRTSDGDRQGDGWGVCWREGGAWKCYRSLKPVWKDRESFSEVPNTDLLVAHARSATFADTKGDVSLNQPFVSGDYAYVFNGHLRGVSLSGVKGRIGSEKIWNLIQREMERKSPADALETVYRLIKKNTKIIFGANIVVVSDFGIWAVSTTEQEGDYFTLRKSLSDREFIISSEEISGYSFEKLKKDKVTEYNL